MVERLDEAECMQLVGTGKLAAWSTTAGYGPVALPIEYKLHEGSIVFRTYQATFAEEDLRTRIAHAEHL